VPGHKYRPYDGGEVGVNDFMVDRADATTTVHAVPLVWLCSCDEPGGMVSHLVDERECPVCGDQRP
jgi:hypothetical protein